jgi:drug/metabolite transporter (DMT)-like permease
MPNTMLQTYEEACHKWKETMHIAPQTRPMAAALSMVTAMCIIGAIDIYVVVIAQTISVWQFFVVRMVLMLPMVVLASALGFGTLRVRNAKAVVLRSLLIALGMVCYFGALAFMPIAMALAGLFTSPIFVLLFTAYGLGQRIGPWRILAVAIGFAGILVVLGPSGTALGWIIALPILGGVLYAVGVVATRAFCAGESTLALLLGIFLAQGALSGLVLGVLTVLQPDMGTGGMAFLTRGWVWPMTDALPLVMLQAVGAFFGVGLLNRAYQLGEASHVAVFEYSIMIFGPFFGWVLLSQPITALEGVGIVLIASAGIIIALRSADI